MRNWKELVVWQECHKLVIEIYNLMKRFPKDETFGLCSQIKRAAVSIPANIVEGHSKSSNKDFVRFLYISRGSLEELKYLLYLSKDLGFINLQDYKSLEEKLARIGYLLNNFMKSLNKTSTTPTTLKTSTTLNTSTTSKTHTPSTTSTNPKIKEFPNESK